MSALPIPEEDGSLPESRRRLADAISGLVDPKPETVDDKLLWTDCVYIQLLEAVPGEKGARTGVSRSQPPLWVDASDLLNEIDTAVSCWEPRPNIDASDDDLPPMTVIRLHAIEDRQWRPQDCHSMEQIAGNVESWTASITTLLSPVARWSLPNPCPACNTAIVYRKDSAGDMVRQPALQIGPNGCECQRCHHIWAPEYFTHLARVMGYELPAGVLE